MSRAESFIYSLGFSMGMVWFSFEGLKQKCFNSESAEAFWGGGESRIEGFMFHSPQKKLRDHMDMNQQKVRY